MKVDHEVAGGFGLGEAADPVPGPGEVLVRVAAFSVNFGEVHGGPDGPGTGRVPGSEAAGVVEAAAADGTGPAVGSPVVTLGADGGWAQLRAVPSGLAAPLPAGTDPGRAATVGVAGTSALRAVRRLGDIDGERVLVTGATGGVGRFAIQLARRSGARPVAVTRRPERDGDALRALGAEEVVASAEQVEGPVRGVVDSVGGPQLVAAFDRLCEHGTLVTVGHSSGDDVVFPYGALLGRPGAHDRSLVTFFLLSTTDLAPDLTWLATEVDRGSLDPGIAWRGPWDDIASATTALLDRTLHGKAVVDIT
ncbi:zinc-binding dehydrogenase [Pseudonocardia sp. KRD291]|uniref:zinc-binding dehydrogenase n=1 Tax=Pseudonocardia sp. KRD291 TaxID=2792007 RepID=UPI0027E38E2C|nr:zinc-binding dehydrogenase [Pseudonocardia sp. KRD291]